VPRLQQPAGQRLSGANARHAALPPAPSGRIWPAPAGGGACHRAGRAGPAPAAWHSAWQPLQPLQLLQPGGIPPTCSLTACSKLSSASCGSPKLSRALPRVRCASGHWGDSAAARPADCTASQNWPTSSSTWRGRGARAWSARGGGAASRRQAPLRCAPAPAARGGPRCFGRG
jgi:hypothetical protein